MTLKPTSVINPYQSPNVASTTAVGSQSWWSAGAVLLILVVGTISGAMLGVATNGINGAVSPDFFEAHRHVLVWSDSTNIWLSSVVQGIVEGSIYGFGYAFILLLLLALFAGGRCRRSAVFKTITICFFSAIAMWLIGGAWGVAHVIHVAALLGLRASPAALRYYWVLGSIRGIELGSIIPVTGFTLRTVVRQRHSIQDDEKTA
jgi:hypothetical protein